MTFFHFYSPPPLFYPILVKIIKLAIDISLFVLQGMYTSVTKNQIKE